MQYINGADRTSEHLSQRRSHLGYTSRLRRIKLFLCGLMASKGTPPLACAEAPGPTIASAVLISTRPLYLLRFGAWSQRSIGVL